MCVYVWMGLERPQEERERRYVEFISLVPQYGGTRPFSQSEKVLQVMSDGGQRRTSTALDNSEMEGELGGESIRGDRLLFDTVHVIITHSLSLSLSS